MSHPLCTFVRLTCSCVNRQTPPGSLVVWFSFKQNFLFTLSRPLCREEWLLLDAVGRPLAEPAGPPRCRPCPEVTVFGEIGFDAGVLVESQCRCLAGFVLRKHKPGPEDPRFPRTAPRGWSSLLMEGSRAGSPGGQGLASQGIPLDRKQEWP